MPEKRLQRTREAYQEVTMLDVVAELERRHFQRVVASFKESGGVVTIPLPERFRRNEDMK